MEPVLDLTRERICVTGGNGFLGKALVRALRANGCMHVAAPGRTSCDLRNRDDIKKLLAGIKPSVVFHLAARSGGIKANYTYPGSFFYDNALMGIQLMEEARLAGVKKFICVGTICTYPKSVETPFREADYWNGYPEETNAPFAVAKKILLVQAQAYRQQYGFNGIYLLQGNVYGPEDDFDLENSHVISAMIRKFIEASDRGEQEVTFWGDGSPTRAFLYRDDSIRRLVSAAERYNAPEPLNIASGEPISMRDLADLIKELTGFSGKISWDTSKPNGQLHRALDTSRAEELLGGASVTPLREGVQKTIAWYRREQAGKYFEAA